MKIVLLGYMGSGKSTIGKLLAINLGMPFIDLDEYIETVEESSIKIIFKEKGEVYFRKKEAESLRQVLSQSNDVVLSIGGGTPCYADNMRAISEVTQNGIYLKLSIPKLVKRLSIAKSSRPLIKNIPDEDLPEFIAKHLFERSFFYEQAINKIDCDDKSPEEIIAEIKKVLS